MIDFIKSRLSSPTLDSYDYISISKKDSDISQLKIFQGNKLIYFNKNIYIYDIAEGNLLSKINIEIEAKNKNLNKLEIIENNKFMVYGKRNIIIYEFINDEANNLSNIIKFSELDYLNSTKDFKIMNVIYNKNFLVLIGENIFSVCRLINNSIQLQITIKTILLSSFNFHTQGFLLNDKIVGIFSSPSKKFEFIDIKKYKSIYITDEISNVLVFYEDNNIINLNDDDRVLIGNKFGAFLFSYKNRNIIKEYEFKINQFYQINNLIYIVDFQSINVFDCYSQKFKKIANLKHKIKNLIVLNEENFLSSEENKIILLSHSKSKKLKKELLFLTTTVFSNFFYTKMFSKIQINIYSIIFSFLLSPLFYFLYIREKNYLLYLLFIVLMILLYDFVCFIFTKKKSK